MHSRIFQISETPITEENLIEEYRYDDWDKADYVVKETYETDIESDLEWVQTANKGLQVNKEKKTITIVSKKEFFESKHEKFIELAEELNYISLDDFISGKEHFKVYDLECAYEDNTAFMWTIMTNG